MAGAVRTFRSFTRTTANLTVGKSDGAVGVPVGGIEGTAVADSDDGDDPPPSLAVRLRPRLSGCSLRRCRLERWRRGVAACATSMTYVPPPRELNLRRFATPTSATAGSREGQVRRRVLGPSQRRRLREWLDLSGRPSRLAPPRGSGRALGFR